MPRWLFGLALLGAVASLPGCPADDEVYPPAVSEPEPIERVGYPNVYPTAPKPLSYSYIPPWTSGHALAVLGEHIFVADEGGQQLAVLDRAELSVIDVVPLGGVPKQLVVHESGAVWLTLRDTGEVVRVSAEDRVVTLRHKIGRRAGGLALNVEGDTLFALAPIEQEMVVLSAATLSELERHETGQTPTAVAVGGSETNTVYVAHRYGDVMTWRLHTDGVLYISDALQLNTGTPTDRAIFPTRMDRLIPNGAVAMAVDPSNGNVSVLHVQTTPGVVSDLSALASGLAVDPSAPPPPPQYYGGADPPDTYNVPTRPVELMLTSYSGNGAMSPIARPPVEHPATGEPLTHLISDPRDIAYHPTHSLAIVVGEGSDSLLVVNTHHGDMMVSPLAHVRVGAMPRAVAFSEDGQYAYVLNGHDYTVSEVALGPLLAPTFVPAKLAEGMSLTGTHKSFPDTLLNYEHMQVVDMDPSRTVTFGEDPASPAVRRGRRLFHFARNPNLSREGHFSCATCHPGGGEDKLVWVVTHGPRQTPSLAGRLAGTAPFNWNGTRHNLAANMERTIGRMGGEGLTDEEMADVETFMLEGLQAMPNPNLNPSGLNYQQKWGQQLFEDPVVGCSGCHNGPETTNNGNFDVGTAVPPEVEAYKALAERGEVDEFNPKAFNVPSLRDLWATAPYLHTGSALTLMDVLTQTDGKMGKTGHLTAAEKDALIAYLLTL